MSDRSRPLNAKRLRYLRFIPSSVPESNDIAANADGSYGKRGSFFFSTTMTRYHRGAATENYARGTELAGAREAGEVGEMRGWCGWPEYEFNGPRNELRSWSIAGRGVAKWGSPNRGDVKSGRDG